MLQHTITITSTTNSTTTAIATTATSPSPGSSPSAHGSPRDLPPPVSGNQMVQDTEPSTPLTPPEPGKPLESAEGQTKGRARKKPLCRFFGSKKGCRAGDACPFAHVVGQSPGGHAPAVEIAEVSSNESIEKTAKSHAGAISGGSAPASSSARQSQRVVPRPVPKQQIQNPRAFQISQIIKRFSARPETFPSYGEMLRFEMSPSDPDFPFEMKTLKCTLEVPLAFPDSPPRLRVSNEEMQLGFRFNVEDGFNAIWREMAHPTLLKAMNVLDKRLEEVLTAGKALTFKIVRNADHGAGESMSQSTAVAHSPTAPSPNLKDAASQPCETPTPERIAQAEMRRRAETQALQNRLGRDPGFSQGGNGTIFTLPIQPRKTKDLPVELATIKSVRLLVPLQYDLDPCTIELLGVSSDIARKVESAFAERGKDHSELPLLAQINYLAQNMHLLAAQQDPAATQALDPSIKLETPMEVKPEPPVDFDRSHIVIISRPPEWSNGPDVLDDSADDWDYINTSSGASDDESGDDDNNNDDDGPSSPTSNDQNLAKPTYQPQYGIMLSFPSLVLHNIELVEITSLHLSVKCDRCKTPADIPNISPASANTAAQPQTRVCQKCSYSFTAAFRSEFMHANSARAGFLDLQACTPLEVHPSTRLTPTCAACSTPYTPGLAALRGTPGPFATCRSCHAQLSLVFHDTKFLRLGAAQVKNDPFPPRRIKPKEQLGLVAGTPLPRRGTCTHYAKSRRWFRFGCCGAVFPCDRCHDAAADHPNEFANRMICGFCSREQVFRPEDCGICRAVLTGRTGRGFWEGGKGTRDRVKMSRKDPRKYRRRGGGALGKAAKAKS